MGTTTAEGGKEMPHKVSRTERTDDALDRYAAAALIGMTSDVSTIAPTVVSYDHAVVAPRRQMTIDVRSVPQRTAELDPREDLAARDAQRRVIAGLPSQRPEPPPPTAAPPTPTEDDIVRAVEGLVPSVLANRGRTMNRIAADMISGLIGSLEIDAGRKRWLISQTRTGVVDPDIFLRDLRLSLQRA